MGVSDVAAQIRSRGYWEVSVRPTSFDEGRVAYDDLDHLLANVVVRLRGWPVPYIDQRRPLLHAQDWIGQDVDSGVTWHSEAWRFFTSGQLNLLRAVSADWRSHQEATPIPEGFQSVIEVWEIVYYVTEVFELAARLSLSPAGDDEMTIEIDLNGLTGRALVVGQFGRVPFSQPYSTTSDRLGQTVIVQRDELVAEAQQRALEVSRDFFVRFGWKTSLEFLAGYQRQLTSPS